MSEQNKNAVVKLEGKSVTANPYQAAQAVKENAGVVMTSESQKAMIEVMTSFEVAKRFPRDLSLAADKILAECRRPTLAELAVYQYSKGGQKIEGPTIRLMEAIARAWGNIQFGWKCLDRTSGKSSIQAFARDLETNTLRETTFDVPHWIDTKGGGYAVKDERSKYELEANQAMRRVRACIEGLIPRDVIDMALEQCESTATESADCSKEGVEKLLNAFSVFGVNKAMIEARIQGTKMEAIKPPQVVGLRKVYSSLKDGIANVEDFFDVALADQKKEASPSTQPDLKAEVERKKEPKAKSCGNCAGAGFRVDGEVKAPCVECKGTGKV